ncbi:MAG TPA: T9SS type A sorting domain-containing protein [Bacteroidia bacterium]|jgi:hypothetical protein|nr:T9SS type A sorting domain-containing protein [Bacteroidia bacterium]
MKLRLLCLLGVMSVWVNAFSQTCTCYVNVDSTYTIVPLTVGPNPGTPPLYQCGECSSQPIPLPFSFCFYGKNYDTVYINNKGTLSFGHPVYNFSSKGFPAGVDTMMLAPLWASVYDSLTPGEVYYKMSPTHLIVQWNTVGYQSFDCDLYDNFQVVITNGSDSILPPGDNVSFCYWLMKWQSADSSGGSGGFGGVPADVGVNKGDGIHYAQFGMFRYHGYYYYGPYDSNSDLYWIDDRSFIFNTCVTGDNLPPIIMNPDSCHKFTVCALDTLSFSSLFLCSEKRQRATLTVSASPPLSGLTTDTTSQYSIDSITVHLIAALADTGVHIITITATDNGSPPLTNERQYTITINPCGDTAKSDTGKGAGINKLRADNAGFTIYPNPNKGKFTITLSHRTAGGSQTIEVYNVLGEKVNFGTLDPPAGGQGDYEIDLSSQPKGIYFIKLFNDTAVFGTEKVVVQ